MTLYRCTTADGGRCPTRHRTAAAAARHAALLGEGWTVQPLGDGPAPAPAAPAAPSPSGWNVYRTDDDDETQQTIVGSAPTLAEARRLARPGDQIQHGLDGEVVFP